ncbi:MAG TPA: sulfite exporter TauE/SafE family protein, partial [Solirubrobacterales bacterium]|nr:sulfite exporter TauE/SafE family protein [Solirubrobacterales bacterium]
TPGALLRFWRTGQLRTPLSRVLLLGTLPGVVLGAVLRVTVLDEPQTILVVVGCVLVPLGSWLVLRRGRSRPAAEDRPLPRWVVPVALAVGVVGGVYGIGGGSILAPILVGFGFSVLEVAPAALAATFLTSVAGVLTYLLLSLEAGGDIAPEWGLGLGMGLGGLAGAYVGARLQTRLPERLLRRALGVLALALGLRYALAVFL